MGQEFVGYGDVEIPISRGKGREIDDPTPRIRTEEVAAPNVRGACVKLRVGIIESRIDVISRGIGERQRKARDKLINVAIDIGIVGADAEAVQIARSLVQRLIEPKLGAVGAPGVVAGECGRVEELRSESG